MKKGVGIIIAIVIVFVIIGGIFFISSDRKDSGLISSDRKDSGLYMSPLSIQTNLSENIFSYELIPNMIMIKKNGENHLIIYPFIPGLNIQEKYSLSEEPYYITPKNKIKVYMKESEGKTGYYVDGKLPFVILPAIEKEDKEINQDIEEFLYSIQ